MQDFETLLKSSALAHGHLCPGQIVGVRMAMLGCRLIELDDPQCHNQIKKLIVFIEMDRCAGDAYFSQAHEITWDRMDWIPQ